MHALIDELAAAGNRRIGTPLLVIPDAAAVAIAPAHEHERPRHPRIHELARLEERRMVAMVESHAHELAGTLRGVDDGIDVGQRTSDGLLDEHVLPR